MVDASKFGRNTFVQIAPLNLVDVVVTDQQPPLDLSAALHEAGVEIILAGAERRGRRRHAPDDALNAPDRARPV